MYLWKIRYTEKMKFYIKIYINVLYEFSLRKLSAKAVSGGFFLILSFLVVKSGKFVVCFCKHV